MIDGNPKWLHYCENYYSCHGWCPLAAIGGDVGENNDYYPEFELAEKFEIKDI